MRRKEKNQNQTVTCFIIYFAGVYRNRKINFDSMCPIKFVHSGFVKRRKISTKRKGESEKGV